MSEEDEALREPKTVAGVPVAAITAPEHLKEGQTKIHKHPEKDEIVQVLALYVLDKQNGKRVPPLAEFERQVSKAFDLDLKGDGQFLQYFMPKYVIPSLHKATPRWVQEGLMEAQAELNTTRGMAEVTERMRRVFDRATRDPEVSPSEVASLGKALIDSYTKMEDSMERFRLIPGKQNSGGKGQTNVNVVDVGSLINTLQGKRGDSIDVEFEVDE